MKLGSGLSCENKARTIPKNDLVELVELGDDAFERHVNKNMPWGYRKRVAHRCSRTRDIWSTHKSGGVGQVLPIEPPLHWATFSLRTPRAVIQTYREKGK